MCVCLRTCLLASWNLKQLWIVLCNHFLLSRSADSVNHLGQGLTFECVYVCVYINMNRSSVFGIHNVKAFKRVIFNETVVKVFSALCEYCSPGIS